MNRIDFTSRINYKVPEEKEKVISGHFDEIMGLYDIIGILESSIDVSIEEEVMTFNIKTQNDQERSNIIERLSNLTVHKFGRRYYFEPEIDNDCLTVILKEK